MAEPSSKRPRVATYDSEEGDHGLAVMLIDTEEEADGTLLLWGISPNDHQKTVLLVCPDYKPYFYVPCPYTVDAEQQAFTELEQDDLRQLRLLLNARLPLESQLESVEVVQQRPIMYYRPEQPDGTPYLKCYLKPGSSTKKAASLVHKLIKHGNLPGFSWRQRGTDAYQDDVKLMTRFLCDASLSGGSWLWACNTPLANGSSSSTITTSQQQQQEHAAEALYEIIPAGSSRRRSSCAIEVVCSWQCLHSLTPDATQLAEHDWKPQVLQQLLPAPSALLSAAAAAANGDILPLKLVVMDVLLAPMDGSNRSCNPAQDPVVTITCHITHTGSHSRNTGTDEHQQQGHHQKVAFVLASPVAVNALPAQLSVEGFRLQVYPTEAALLLAWRDWMHEVDPDGVVVFQVRDNLGVLAARFTALNLDGGGCHISRAVRHRSKGLSTKSVVMYSVAWVKSQSRMASTSNQETFRTKGMAGRLVLDVLRQVLTSQSLATFSLVDCCHSLLNRTLEVMPNHTVAALQQQLAATPPAAQHADSTSPTSEQGSAAMSTATAATATGMGGISENQLPGVRAAVRLARYSLGRCWAVASLMERLASVPEVFEMARATGLTLEQVLYNAQMIRTWSLLLRTSHRRGYIVAGRTESAALVESPYLMHPIEHKTSGLYNTPVATLDFASLYPSLYRAYNLCYTTLVHPDDVARIGAEQCTITPTGAAFLQPSVRPGILPHILSALMSARATTRAVLKGVQKQLQQEKHAQQQGGGSSSSTTAHPGRHAESIAELAARAAVLDGRQKALKVTANALYGFTGAQASPLQCAPLADSCLALGAATCRAAVAAITAALEQQQLGPKAVGGKVIYAQTDSVFIHFPSATAAEAVGLGQHAAQLVTSQLPPPIELKYERVCSPFMLLHVNRYAGCSYETAAAAEAGEGQLLVKGIKAVWRQSAQLLQNTLMGALEMIIMTRDVPGALSYVEGQIARLLSGRVELWELVMTGGLWRVTGQQLEKAAAAAAEEEGGGNGSAAAASAGAGEDVKGPHASLAVRLSQRDPDKKWLLGERLSYVLLTGAQTQDEAAEDPLTAAQLGLSPNYELYFTNKLQIPLKEIFSTCLNPDQMRHLLHGPHTSFRANTTTAGDLGGSTTAGGLAGAAGGPGADAVDVLGATSSSTGRDRGRGRGRGRSKSAEGGARGTARGGGRGKAGAVSIGSPADKKKTAGVSAGKGRQQGMAGMRAFFQQSAKCLGCKQVLKRPAVNIGSGNGQQEQLIDLGLCERCEQEDGKREQVYITVMQEASTAAAAFAKAQSACRSCHSGGQLGAVVCENGECPVVYERLSSERQSRTAEQKLLRLDVLDW